MIVSIEGPNLAGKTTLVRELERLCCRADVPCTVIPEYVDYLGDQNKQPERPLRSRAQMVAEGRFYVALEQVRQRDVAQAIAEHGATHLVLTDRTFFTCLAYARISGNPVAEEMFQRYVGSADFVPPDRILFLCIDPSSAEYQRRKAERKSRNPWCRGLSFKVQEYGYIYRNQDYERYFREHVTRRVGNIAFLDALRTSAADLFSLIREEDRWVPR